VGHRALKSKISKRWNNALLQNLAHALSSLSVGKT